MNSITVICRVLRANVFRQGYPEVSKDSAETVAFYRALAQPLGFA